MIFIICNICNVSYVTNGSIESVYVSIDRERTFFFLSFWIDFTRGTELHVDFYDSEPP